MACTRTRTTALDSPKGKKVSKAMTKYPSWAWYCLPVITVPVAVHLLVVLNLMTMMMNLRTMLMHRPGVYGNA